MLVKELFNIRQSRKWYKSQLVLDCFFDTLSFLDLEGVFCFISLSFFVFSWICFSNSNFFSSFFYCFSNFWKIIFWTIRQFPLRNLRKFENLTYFGLFRKKCWNFGEFSSKFVNFRQLRGKISEILKIDLWKCEKKLTKFCWIFECWAVQKRFSWFFY